MNYMSDLQRSYYSSYTENEVPAYIIKKIKIKNFDLSKFKNTLTKVIDKYDILRCKMFSDGSIEYYNSNEYELSSFEICDIRNSNQIKVLKEFESKFTIDIGNPEDANLLKIKIFQISDDDVIVYFRTDGLITDGYSANILINEIELFYDESNSNNICESYSNYCDFCNEIKKSTQYNDDKKFWIEYINLFSGNPVLPVIENYESIEHFKPIEIKKSLHNISEDKIKLFAEKNNISEFSVRLTAFCKTLELFSEESSFTINIPYDKRFNGKFENLYGECADFYIYQYDYIENESLKETALRVDKKINEIKQHLLFSGNDIIRQTVELTNSQIKEFTIVYTDLLDDNIKLNKFIDCDMLSHTPSVWLDTVLFKSEGKIKINFDSSENTFKDNFINNFASSFVKALESVDRWGKIKNIDLPNKQESFLRDYFNTDYKRDNISYAEIIEYCIEKYGEKKAVVSKNGSISYDDFFDSVKSISSYIEKKITKNNRIAVILNKGTKLMKWAEGIVLSGNTYVPIDSEYPENILNNCLDTLEIKYIVTENEFIDKFNLNEKYSIINTDEIKIPIDTEYKFVSSSSESIFAIIHTSGTTGKPKAAELTHSGILNVLLFTAEKFNISSDDVLLAITNHCHDMSLYDIFGIYISGGTVAVMEEKEWKDPYIWLDTMNRFGVTVWNSVPSVMCAFIDSTAEDSREAIKNLRVVIHGGENIPVTELLKIREYSPECKFISVGGPTETTIWSIYHFVTEEDIENGFIPYGVPISNMRYRLFNKNMKDVPYGIKGLMYASGIGTIDHYVGNINTEKFITDSEGIVWYNTGDLGVYSEKGYIVFKGRADNQIKRFGKRIELDGIERTALINTDIQSVKVICDGDDSDLIMYYCSKRAIKEDNLRSELLKYLPSYMMPQYFVQVDKMPLTRNGKIDTKELKKIGKVNTGNCIIENIEDDTEYIKFLKLVEKCIGLNHIINLEDNFFALGGNSLKAMKLSSEIRKIYNVKITLRNIFANPVIKDIYNFVTKAFVTEKSNEDIPDNYDDKFMLTRLQKIIFLGDLMGKRIDNLILSGYSDFNSILDYKILRKACIIAWQRQDALHFNFEIDDEGEAYQKISAEKFDFNKIIFIKESTDLEKDTAELAEWTPDIKNGINGRIIYLVNKEKNKSRLVITLHHIISDEASFKILFRDIDNYYNMILSAGIIPHPERISSFQKYLIEKSSKSNTNDYQLKNFRLPNVIKSKNNSKILDEGKTVTIEINSNSIKKLGQLCSRKGTTLFIGLLAAVSVSFMIETANDYNGFILPVSDRTVEHDDSVGNYIEEYFYAPHIDKNMSLEDIIEYTDKKYRDVYQLGADNFVDYLKNSGQENEFMKRRIGYPYFNFYDSSFENESESFRFYEKEETAETNIIYMVTGYGDIYEFMLGYKEAFCDDTFAMQLSNSFEKTIEMMVETPEQKISELNINFDTGSNQIEPDNKIVVESNTFNSSDELDTNEDDAENYIDLIRKSWEEVLGHKCEDDINFFDAGGSSFLLYKLNASINKNINKKISFISLMTYPTIESFAEYISDMEDDE